MAAGPDILNHNVETVARLQKPVRKRARYERSLGVLARAKEYARELSPSSAAEKPAAPAVHTKSSIMVGLGETRPELHQTFLDLRAVDCDILTLGQYLRPSPAHLPVERYYHPDEFAEMREEALALGFKHVESGPLVRSSYHARDQVPDAELEWRAWREWLRRRAWCRRWLGPPPALQSIPMGGLSIELASRTGRGAGCPSRRSSRLSNPPPSRRFSATGWSGCPRSTPPVAQRRPRPAR